MIDSEALEILKGFPVEPETDASAWFPLQNYALNARLFLRKRGDGDFELSIFPDEGGWLGIELKDIRGDIAPFSG